MEIRLLPAPAGPSDVSGAPAASTSLVLVGRSAIVTRVNTRIDIARRDDGYASSGWGGGRRIYGTPVDAESESASGETGNSAAEYVSGSWWTKPIDLIAAAQYLMYAAMSTAGRGQLINVYA